MQNKVFNFKILIPVWGKDYIDLFCSAGLCSLMLHENIPALLSRGKVKVCILTSKNSVDLFTNQAAFIKLKNIVKVEFSFIDDLLSISSYGVLLTKAYERGIVEESCEMLNTHFIFLNADLVLSNNTFKTVIKYLDANNSVVLISAVRCNMEDVVLKLKNIFSQNNDLVLFPRELVGIGLENLHATVLSKLVNQKIIHNSVANQFYWKINSSSLIARCFLLFALCIKPEKIYKEASGYFDYNIVTDLCPSNNYAVIEDSDELFILELSKINQEREHIKFGGKCAKDFVSRLSQWTVQDHRDYSRNTFIYHIEDICSSFVDAKNELDIFMKEIYKNLSLPVSKINHPYWIYNVTNVQLLDVRAKINSLDWIANSINLLQYFNNRLLNNIFNLIQYLIFGKPPYVRCWHPDWLDYRSILRMLDNIFFNKVDNLLYFTDGTDNNILECFLKKNTNIINLQKNNLYGLLHEDAHKLKDKQTLLIYIASKNLHLISPLMKIIPKSCKTIIIVNGLLENFNELEIVNYFLPICNQVKDYCVVGGWLKILLKQNILKDLKNLKQGNFILKSYYILRIIFNIIKIFLFVNVADIIYKNKEHSYFSSGVFVVNG